MLRLPLALCLGLLLPQIVVGQHGHPAPSDSAGVPLFDNLGTLHHAISARTPRAQAYFDQGLRLTYGFNHEEAANSFREAARLDPGCAMCYWGIALALGPNINLPMEAPAEREAYAAVREALRRAPGASPRERAYIGALAKRYGEPAGADRRARDSAYAAAMREVARAHPEDPDAATLFAESLLDLRPWDQWTRSGDPQPGTLEVVEALERVLARDPGHPGACHYYIHTVEASRRPERALPCAERLPSLMPGAGHLVHMPAHIYMRLGMYDRATEANEHAAHADEVYLEGRRPAGMYPFYYGHNLHFLWAASAAEGRSEAALKAARGAAGQVPVELARQMPFLQFYLPTPLYALARFGRWEEILSEPAPLVDLRYARAMWHHARGLALVGTRRAAEAGAELDSVAAIRRSTPADQVMGMHPAPDLLGVAEHLLSGRILAARGDAQGAVRELRRALEIEDGFRYDEPPPWYSPTRQALGSVLLRAGRAAEAEAVFREDLLVNRNNGWSLYGLARALRAQEKDAGEVEARFRKSWARSDVAAPPLW
jgi:tetratricopeptide (TPR) repeat protein